MDRLYWLGVQTIMPGWGRRAWAMIEYFGTVKDFWSAPESEILAYPSGSREARERLALRRNSLDLIKEEEKIKNAGMTYVTIKDKNYPEDLKHIPDPPPALFVRGNIEINGYAIAIVGSRKATPYGLMVAETLSRDLAKAGLIIVSGLARGVDTAAHRGTLSVNGKTIAVLGCGLNVAYPRENRRLMDDIVAKGGAVISEFPLG
ncbi:MAG TPA: DNA-processing protein DprA, partial [Clostridia bacterium]|nr:DNA-processing protein DprA [Clostridia bacterium]